MHVQIVSVDPRPEQAAWVIGQRETDPDGTTRLAGHQIPVCAFYNHTAEYGLDPADSRAVLDMLLHSRFETAPPDPADPHSPYRTTPQLAWEHRMQAIDQVKQTVTIEDPDGLLDVIHAAHVPHPAAVQAARDRVAQTRAGVARADRQRAGLVRAWPAPMMGR